MRRTLSVIMIPAIKIVNFGVKIFHSIRVVWWWWFFGYCLLKRMIKLETEKKSVYFCLFLTTLQVF